MAIAPFRASLQSLSSEQLRAAMRTMAGKELPPTPQGLPPSEMTGGHDSAPALYSYQHSTASSRLCGVIALIGPEGAHLRCPMPARPDDVAFARQYLCAKRHQLQPVLAFYDSEPLPRLEAMLQRAAGGEDELRITPISDPLILSELNSALNDLPLTVIAGQEWTEAANGHPVMALLVNQRTCTPEFAPLHRTIRWKPGWHAGDMVRLAREHFFFHDISRLMPQFGETQIRFFGPAASDYLCPRVPGETVFLAVTAQHTFRIHSLPGWADTVLAHRSPEERSIGSVQLHEILIPKGSQLPSATCAEQVSYTGNMDEAVARVIRGEADVAFLMNAPSIQQIDAVARTGGSIPTLSYRARLEPIPGAIAYAF